MTNAIEALMQAALNAPARRRQDALRVLQGDGLVAEEPDVAPANEPYLSLGDLAKRLGVSRITLWRWRVPGHDLGGRLRYRVSDVAAYLKTDAHRRRVAALRAERRELKRNVPARAE